jgi:uncharacterized RDD family membrane protein YckC
MTGRLPAVPPNEVRAPSVRRRMACFVYEGMLMFGMLLIPGAVGAAIVAASGEQHAAYSDLVLQAVAIVMYGAYFTWFWSRRGQTLPMQTWHIRLVDASGQAPGRWRSLARYLAASVWLAPAWALGVANGWEPRDKLVAIAIGIVAYALLALLHPQRQFWHDALCGTRLVSWRPTGAPAQPA